MKGFVSLVGAGPGDPDLLTQRAVKRLASADLVLYDGLVPDAVLQLAQNATCVSVAKRAGGNHLSQDWINDEMIHAARGGLFVVRLKAGDPFVLGRGGEEALALAEAGVPFEVVPGVSSAVGAPALAGIPVTHRGLSSGFVVVSGHAPQAYEALVRSLEPGSATVVVLMGIKARATIAAHLISRGWDPATPVAIVNSASQPEQHTWTGALGNIDQYPAELAGDAPGVIVIGQVVSLRAEIARIDLLEEEWKSTTTLER
jgi:uroporphyrin-III C-methyltransferase / precorrin-2 dehydrogenase / sirohydrochlorin ferrochelatase